jgi:predicted alpha/beta superfamily hydrolase
MSPRGRWIAALGPLALALGLVAASPACGGSDTVPTGSVASAGGGTPSSATGTGSTAASVSTTSSSSGAGGAGPETLQDLLARLRADRDKTLLEESNEGGWPVRVVEGLVVVSTDPAYHQVAGDFDAWTGTELTADQGFLWGLLPDTKGQRYKLATGQAFESDPWSRGFAYDQYGELSLVPADATAHLERFFQVKTATLAPRTVRIWIPAEPPTHVLYAEDGQNLFDPAAPWGGWKLDTTIPPAMMVVGIDNTAARMDEYTHVPDIIDGTSTNFVGGLGDAYGDLIETQVRPLVAAHYGEPPKRGLLGSSLGGLISLHVANKHPGEFAFAASMSGTLGWGSIGATVHNATMMDRFLAAGHAGTVIFLDSGGGGTTCADSDMDGVDDDDPTDEDNYCETAQMRDLLASMGYQFNVDLYHWHEAGALHNEAAWAARVFRPLQIFAAL